MQRYQIELTNKTLRDISGIYNYIRKDSIYYAVKTNNEIEKRILNLSFMPFMGRKLIDSENNNIFRFVRRCFE